MDDNKDGEGRSERNVGSACGEPFHAGLRPSFPARWRFGRGVRCVVLIVMSVACGEPASVLPAETTDVVEESEDVGQRFVGTWTLARVDRYDQSGTALPDFVHPEIGAGKPLGYLMYDGERMALAVQQEGRMATVGNTLTPEGVLAAVEGYSAYFGPYSVDVANGYLSHEVAGSLNPGGAGGETQPFYEFVENELVLTPSLQCPDSFLTDRGCGYGTTGIQLRNVWEKVESTTAGDIDTRFLGFWQIDRVERRTPDGREVLTPQYEQGYLIYMPSGHMMVHLMRPDRAFYEGARPTATEAAVAMQGYVSYVGSFTVDGNAAVVLHRRDGHLNPNRVGDEAFRSFEFRNDQLILKPPAADVDGQVLQTVVYWNRLSVVNSN